MIRQRLSRSLGVASAIAVALLAVAGVTAVRAETPSTGLDRLLELREERAGLVAEHDAASGEQREIIEEQIWQTRVASFDTLRSIVEALEAGGDAGSAERTAVVAWLRDSWPRLQETIVAQERDFAELREQRETVSPEELAGLDREIRHDRERLVETYRLLTDALVLLEPAGFEIVAQREFVESQLVEWADRLAAQIQLLARDREHAASLAADAPQDAEAAAGLADVEGQLEISTEELTAASDMLDQLGVSVSDYQQVLIAATGQITTDILDAEVALGLLRRMGENLMESLASGGPGWLFKALIFLAILFVFRTASSLVRRAVGQSVGNPSLKLSQLLQETLIAWSSRVVMAVGLLLALSQLGIEIGALLAGLGIAGFVLGFALQDTLANFASGAMILMYRPFDVNDIIEAATVTGTVSKMTLVSTTILTFDNQTLIVPNSKIWGDVIRNVTAQDIRRVDMVFGIGYGDDIDKADAILRDILANQENVLEEPKPIVEVHSLGESSVDFVVRPWVRTVNYWPTYWAITREVKQRFDREGVSIPFPQRDVHHYFEQPPPTA